MPTISQIIQKKADHQEWNHEEIKIFVQAVANKQIPDYLITSWLMAVYINQLTIEETFYLTQEICNYSNCIDFRSDHDQIIIDKHSSGGVGDKVTLILAPILASLDLDIAKLSGRGLGFTGGTIDKLNSVGIKTDFSLEEMKGLLKKNHMFVASQTKDLAPVDKVLYQLRDVTNTFSSCGLITSSILSKKFSILGTHVYIDLKSGTGAFFEKQEDTEKLAKYMLNVATMMKRHITIFVTGMDQPLGNAIGNCLEVAETIDFLSGNYDKYPDLKELIFTLCQKILCENIKKMTDDQAYQKIKDTIDNGKAIDKFYQWAESQGGNKKEIEKMICQKADRSCKVVSEQDGYLSYESVKQIGIIANELGAGRTLSTDKIDFFAGIVLNKKNSDFVKKGDIIATLYSSKSFDDKEMTQKFLKNCIFSKKQSNSEKIIRKILTNTYEF